MTSLSLVTLCATLLVALARTAVAVPLDGFARGPAGEQERLVQLPDDVRLYQNAADDFDPARPTDLLLYATPNGNSIEQTLGAKPTPGETLDWHFDIQHVAAQTRTLRRLDPSRNRVLAVLQPDPKSWPTFRAAHADNPQRITAIVAEALRPLPPDTTITLAGHSGGGSFMFGYINADPAIPDRVTRIAFLDADYAYADDPSARHGDKLLAWLKSAPAHALVVIAYDDREITFEGKKVVGPTGGTYRATARMTARFAKDLTLTSDHYGPFIHQSALGGRAQFFVHPNPDNKILHTALVGDMNGWLHALTVATPLEQKWGTFGGPRAYADQIQTAPSTRPTSAIPPRDPTSITGAAFAKQIAPLPPADREAAIFTALSAGNLPAHLRQFKTLRLEHEGHLAELRVMPDYLSVGSDADFLRLPMTPQTARRLADAWNCMLPTRRIVDAAYAQADLKLNPKPMTDRRESVDTFLEHNALIDSQRADRPFTLIAGIKKDVVLTPRLLDHPGHVAIYGWHRAANDPIQPLTTVHVDRYVDYSHGIRLVSRDVVVDGNPTTVDAVLNDPTLAPLLSDEGVMDIGTMYVTMP